jgi:hypothetical protein
MRSPSPSDLGYDSLSGSSESGYDSLLGSSVDEEISRSLKNYNKVPRYDNPDSRGVVFVDAVFEDDVYPVGSSANKKRYKSTRVNPSKPSCYDSEDSDVTDVESSSDVVRYSSPRRRKKLRTDSSLSSVSYEGKSPRKTHNVNDDDVNDIADHAAVEREVQEAIDVAQYKSEKPGVVREFKSLDTAAPSDMFPLTANVFCPECLHVHHSFIIDGQVRERPLREVQLLFWVFFYLGNSLI